MSVRLAIAIPCHVFVAPQMAQSLAAMCAFYVLDSRVSERGWEMIGPRFFGNAVSTFGRNELVRWAKDYDATHVLWIDTDSVFPHNAARRLLVTSLMYVKRDVAFIGANFALKDGSGQSAAWGLDGERLKPRAEGIEEVSTLGFGLTLTRMDVLDAVGDPWFKVEDGMRGGPADEYRFCQLARAAGFPPHVDHALSRECRHVGLHPFELPTPPREMIVGSFKTMRLPGDEQWLQSNAQAKQDEYAAMFRNAMPSSETTVGLKNACGGCDDDEAFTGRYDFDNPREFAFVCSKCTTRIEADRGWRPPRRWPA